MLQLTPMLQFLSSFEQSGSDTKYSTTMDRPHSEATSSGVILFSFFFMYRAILNQILHHLQVSALCSKVKGSRTAMSNRIRVSTFFQ